MTEQEKFLAQVIAEAVQRETKELRARVTLLETHLRKHDAHLPHVVQMLVWLGDHVVVEDDEPINVKDLWRDVSESLEAAVGKKAKAAVRRAVADGPPRVTIRGDDDDDYDGYIDDDEEAAR